MRISDAKREAKNRDLFNKVDAATDAYYLKTGKMERVLAVMSAENNGSQTAYEHGHKGNPEEYAEYWSVCVGTLESNLSDRSVAESERKWFRKLGLTI